MFEELTAAQVQQYLIRFSIEAILLSSCLLVAYFGLGFRQVLQTIGGWRAKTILFFLVALTTTQLVDRWQYHFPPKISFFPLARFAMYQTGRVQDPVMSYRWEGQFESTVQEINPICEFPAVGLPSLSTRFRIIAERLQSADTQQVAWAQQQIRAYGAALLRQRQAKQQPVPHQLRFLVESCHLAADSPIPHRTTEQAYEFSTSSILADGGKH